MIKKTVKQVGMSLGIIFNKEERRVYDINLGDVVEVKTDGKRTKSI